MVTHSQAGDVAGDGSRLWLGAVCRPRRDKQLARQIITCVYNWAQQLPLVIAFDGWSAYPKACSHLFREPIFTGRVGSPRKQPWACLNLVQLVKYQNQRWLMKRWLLSGSATMVRYLLNLTQGVDTTINTAYIERLNATFRSHLSFLVRRTRCPARRQQTVTERVFLLGCVYNFCVIHSSLSDRTPAMAAGLTHHLWSVADFLWFRPSPYSAAHHLR